VLATVTLQWGSKTNWLSCVARSSLLCLFSKVHCSEMLHARAGVDLMIQVSLQSHWFGVFQTDSVLKEHSSISVRDLTITVLILRLLSIISDQFRKSWQRHVTSSASPGAFRRSVPLCLPRSLHSLLHAPQYVFLRRDADRPVQLHRASIVVPETFLL
jgi:hypothetical protein